METSAAGITLRKRTEDRQGDSLTVNGPGTYTFRGRTVRIEMLDGLTAGHNFLWDLTYQTRIFEYLQLNLQYEGRVTDNGKLIHTGFLQLKAFF